MARAVPIAHNSLRVFLQEMQVLSAYDKLGLSPIINAAGTLTRLGGTVMLAEVRDAMSQAANELVPMEELQAVASAVIAQCCGSEAGIVSSGASAGMTLATAACMVGLDIAAMDRLPGATGGRNEVVICRTHRNSYDHAFRAAGATLVEVGMSDRLAGVGVREPELWEIDAAITERTAAIGFTAGSASGPTLGAVSALARRRGVPVIVDAAAQLPPPSNLRRFVAEGADLVSFSGGKALRGPPGTGILAGRRDLIASAALQQLDMDVSFEMWNPPAGLISKEKLAGVPRHGIGRGYKVGREQIVGLITALRLFTEERVVADHARWMDLLQTLEHGLQQCSKATAMLVRPAQALGFPLLEIHLNEAALGFTACELAARLKNGRPPIYVGERKIAQGCIGIHPVNLDEAAARTVLHRLLAELQRG